MFFLGFIIAVAVPILMIFWGGRLRKNPPAYGRGRFSFRTKFARQDEDMWNFSNTLFSHMITVTGVNVGIVSIVFYLGVMFLEGSLRWAAASFSLMAVQAVCVLVIWRITNFIAKKTYPAPEDEESEEEEPEKIESEDEEPEKKEPEDEELEEERPEDEDSEEEPDSADADGRTEPEARSPV